MMDMKKSTMTKNKRKAFSQTIWIIVAIVIALATAVIVLALLTSTSGDVKRSAGDATDTAGTTLKEQLCAESCRSCLRVYDDCNSAHWPALSIETGCVDIMPTCV